MKPAPYLAGAAAAVAAQALYFALSPAAPPEAPAPAAEALPEGAAMVAVRVPALDGAAAIGQRAFAAKCAACHGPDAGGRQGVAPPLVHRYYEPSHHADEAFQRAVQKGVRAHHWRFGDMPPVEGLTRADVANIVAYVRRLQQANGID